MSNKLRESSGMFRNKKCKHNEIHFILFESVTEDNTDPSKQPTSNAPVNPELELIVTRMGSRVVCFSL